MPFGPALLLTVPRPGPGAWPSDENNSTREAHLCTPYSRELGYSNQYIGLRCPSNQTDVQTVICSSTQSTTLPPATTPDYHTAPCPTTSRCQELSIPGKCPHVHSRQNELQNSIANAIETALPIPPLFHSITQEKANVSQRSICLC